MPLASPSPIVSLFDLYTEHWAPLKMDSKKISHRQFFCGHCHKDVSRRTFSLHKRLYYNRVLRKWSSSQLSSVDTSSSSSNPVNTVQEDLDKESPFEFESVQYSPVSSDEGKQ